MRGVVLALALMLVPSGVAQQSTFESFSDVTGDVELQGTLLPGTDDPTGFYPNVDLVAGGVWAEDDMSLTFYLQVADLAQDSQTPLPFSDPDYYLYFNFGEQGYRIQITTALENTANDVFGRSGASTARLQLQQAEQFYSNLADATLEMQFSDDRMLVTILRQHVVDHNLAPLAINSTLTDIYATGQSMGWFDIPFFGGGGVGMPRAIDVAPDLTFGEPYTMKTGSLIARGDLSAVSDDPIRWTNGEATTMRFSTTLVNRGPAKDITVAVEGADPRWQVAYSDRINVAADSRTNVSLLVSIPFGHAHGVLKTFDVRFQDRAGEHMATAQLGVYWPKIPQPAGHHDTLYFHSRAQDPPQPPFDALFSGIHGWMSAGDETAEELDEGLAIPAFTNPFGGFGGAGGQSSAIWFLPLEPQLRLGMDFDLERLGAATLSIELPVPMVDVQVDASLNHRIVTQSSGRGGGTGVLRELATGTSEVATGIVSGKQTFEFDLQPTEYADLVDYDPRANLYLVLQLRGTGGVGSFVDPVGLSPTLDPSASTLKLPLLEYNDPVDLQFATDATLDLVVDENGQARDVNPGETVVYTFAMHFTGQKATTFDVSISGPQAEWGQIIGDQTFSLVPGVNRTLAFAVSAPDDARNGELADITLTVTSRQNAALQAGVVTRTAVTTEVDLPDESDRLTSLDGELSRSKDSPSPAWVLLVALAALTLRRRR